MQGLNPMLGEKLGPRLAEPGGRNDRADLAKKPAVALAEVKSRRLHSWTPFSTAASSSLTLSSVDPPSL